MKTATETSTTRIELISLHDPTVASTRLRLMPLIPSLQRQGFSPTSRFALEGDALRSWLTGGWGRLKALWRSRRQLSQMRKGLSNCALAVVQREALPINSLAIERFLARNEIPFIWDVDDALWSAHRAPASLIRGTRAKYAWLASHATEVWAGNTNIARWAVSNGAHRVRIVPTTVNVTAKTDHSREDDLLVWVGTQSTAGFMEKLLEEIQDALASWRILVVGATINVPRNVRVEHQPWSIENERIALARATVGLYPLDRSHPMVDGKSALKSILFRSHGVPIIVTPTRSTRAVMEPEGEGGFFADSPDEWRNALQLMTSPKVRDTMATDAYKATSTRFNQGHLMEALTRHLLQMIRNHSDPIARTTSQGGILPRVSVVMPVYNGSRWLQEALDSIRNQTLNEWELIVVDDGSSDDSVEIVKRFANKVDQPVQVICQENLGGASARNTGALAATAPLLAFIDCDDLWDPDKLRLQVSLLEEDPEAIGCGCAYEFMDEAGNRNFAAVAFDWTAESVRRWFLLEDYGPGFNSTAVLRKSAFVEAGMYDSSLRFGEDSDLAWRLRNLGHIYSLTSELAFYRIRADQVHRDTGLFQISVARILTKNLESAGSELNRGLRNLFVLVALYRWRDGDHMTALTTIARELKRDSTGTLGQLLRIANRRIHTRRP